MRQVYLDHQSATPLLPEALEAMRPFLTETFGNPSSLHRHGLRARDALDQARSALASLVNAESPEEIILTSGGAEAVNLAVKGCAYASQRHGDHIVVGAIEHPAVLNSVEFLLKHGFTCTRVMVDAAGRLDPADVRAALTGKTVLLAVHHVNYDIGTIEPIEEIGRIAADAGVPFFVDAVSSAGWLPIDVQAMGISLLALSAHRFHGPKGVGMLYRNRRIRLTSLIHGGDQEGGRRAGTENVPAIVGAGVAAEIARRELPARTGHVVSLQRRLWEGLRANVDYVRLNGPEPGAGRVGTNLNVSTEFVEGEGQMLLCDLQGVAFASGTACTSRSLRISPVLAAIGLDAALARGSVLMTLGKDNTAEEMDYTVATFAAVTGKLRNLSPTWEEFQRGIIDSAIRPSHAPAPEA